MPIEVGLWRLGDRLQPVAFTGMDSEGRLETVLAADITVVDPGWLLIGRQVPTAYGKFIDLLAIDAEGQLVVIELKKNRTPREVVAQLLDYGSWVRGLEDDEIATIFEAFVAKYHPEHKATSLDEAFCERFKVEEMPESLNEAHKLVLVASELDDSSERIITYLAEAYGVSISEHGVTLERARALAQAGIEAHAACERVRPKYEWLRDYCVASTRDGG